MCRPGPARQGQGRPGAAGDDQPVVREGLAGVEQQPARVRVGVEDAGAGPPDHAGVAAQVERGVLGALVAVEQALGAGGPVVRADRLGADRDHLAGEPEPAQLAGRAPAGRAGADDDDPVPRAEGGPADAA
jgi:hypothetical protein